MNRLKFMGMALLAIIMSVNFTACSSDDDPTTNDNGVITNEKKLVTVHQSASYSYDKTSIAFSYDSKDRLTKICLSSNSNIYEKEFSWGNNTIIGYSQTFNLSEGHVISADPGYKFKYNTSNQLISCEYGAITWENGKMVSCNDGSVTLNYDGKTCSKGYFPLISPAIFYTIDCGANYYDDDDIALFMAHPELCGIRTKQLPNKVKSYGDDITLDYTFTKDGYIESCTLKKSTTYPSGGIIMTFEWE